MCSALTTRCSFPTGRNHLSKGQMEELSPAEVASLPKFTVIARIRFIPKTDSMRPITRVIGADAKTRVSICFFFIV